MMGTDRDNLLAEALRTANPLGPETLAQLNDGELAGRLRAKVDDVLERDGSVSFRPPRGRARPFERYALISLVVIGTAVAATPQGRALAERVADVVGIGDEPSREATSPIDEPAVVIGAGHTPNGTRYEIVASGDMNIFRDDEPTTCVSLDLVGLKAPTNAACLTEGSIRTPDRQLVQPIAYLGPRELGADRLIVDGLASPEVESAAIEHREGSGAVRSYPAVVGELDRALAERIGASREVNFVVAFLPEDLVPPDPTPSQFGPPRPAYKGNPQVIDALSRLTVVTYTGDGTELARRPLGTHRFDETILYGAQSTRRPEDEALMIEDCAREVLPAYGRLGEIKPELPPRFGRDVNRCVEERREARRG